MKVIPLEKKLGGNSLKSQLWMHYTEKATASHGNRGEGNLAPEADGQHHPDHCSLLLLEAAAHCRQPFGSLSSHTCFPKCISPQQRGKTKDSDFQRETPWENFLPPQISTRDQIEKQMFWFSSSTACFPFGMQHSPCHDLGHKGQQYTSHTISINDNTYFISINDIPMLYVRVFSFENVHTA